MSRYFDRFGLAAASRFGVAILSNTRSKCSTGSRSRTSRAVAMNRLNCSGLSGWGFGLRGMAQYTMRYLLIQPCDAMQDSWASLTAVMLACPSGVFMPAAMVGRRPGSIGAGCWRPASRTTGTQARFASYADISGCLPGIGWYIAVTQPHNGTVKTNANIVRECRMASLPFSANVAPCARWPCGQRSGIMHEPAGRDATPRPPMPPYGPSLGRDSIRRGGGLLHAFSSKRVGSDSRDQCKARFCFS